MARRKPTRAGILNVWEYDSQTFSFGDGRLALRGRNGSGKSNALSLLFPFVFDGVMSAQRMDPMGGARSMRSLLLCRDDDNPAAGYRFDSRTGYVWMEFDGAAGPLTIGIGATASGQRPDTTAWFFVTERRVGVDLDLELEHRPRSHRELVAELSPGEVFATAEEYRAVVDQRLFGVGAARARRLVDLLLVLRRPHLAGKLDPDSVSATLSAGLQSLDANLVADVARSFDDLEATQQELHDLQTSLDVVERFLPLYVEHLVHHVRRRAEELVGTNRHLRDLRRRRSDAESAKDAAGDRTDELVAAIDDLSRAIAADETEVEVILASGAYQAIGMLDEVGKQVQSATESAAAADARTQAAQNRHVAAVAALADEHTQLDIAERSTSQALEATRHFAAQAGLTSTQSATDPAVVRAQLAVRRDNVAEVRGSLRNAETTAAVAASRAASAETAQILHLAAADALTESTAKVETTRHALFAAVHEWMDQTRDLISAAVSVLERRADSTGRQRTGPLDTGPLAELTALLASDIGEGARVTIALAARNDLDPARAAIQEASRDAARHQAALLNERVRLTGERDRIAREPNPGPPASPTRPDASAPDRPGAPLYACVDFHPAVPIDERAAWESALQAAGLLDARLFTDGAVDEALDAALISGTTEAPYGASAVPTLADLLTPVSCNGVGTEAIAELLASIALESDAVSLRRDGTWRIGPVMGRFGKSVPEFIGHEARERRRTERLGELDAQIADVINEITAVDATIDSLSQMRAQIDLALASLPPTDSFEQAVRHEHADRAAAEAADVALEAAVAERDRAATAAEAADGALRMLAVTYRLGTAHPALDAIDQAVRDADRAASDWHHGAVMVTERHRRVDAAASTRALLATDVATAMADWRTQADRAELERKRWDVLYQQVGAEAAAAERDLRTARERRDLHRHDTSVRRGEHAASVEALNRLVNVIEGLDHDIDNNGQRFERAVTAYVAVCSTDVVEALRSAGIDSVTQPATPDAAPAVRAAQAALDATTAVADGATDRMMKAYQQHLLDGLRAGHDPRLEGYDDVGVVRVMTVDGEVGVGRLVESLRADTVKLASLLSDRERQIFETHLLTRVSEALRELLVAADEFEQSINAQMAEAPTESGMRVELKWEINDDRRGLKDALGLLRFASDMLGAEQREQLRSFFATAIQTARAEDPGRSFADTLSEILNYRNWHRFTLYARFGDGQRRQMTRTFFRELSGGEAATVLHLPLFAAAAAHYSTCSPDAPRLIALDEAFVGIDERMRGRLMGLLVSLDLDVLLTSHEFWGAYAEVPQLVVYDLMRRPPAMGVSAQQFTWLAGRPSNDG